MTKEEYNNLVTEYYRIVYKKVLKSVRMCEQTAEDITQEIFLKAYQYRHQWNRSAKASSWLYRITANEIGQHYRKKNRKFVLEYLDSRALDEVPESEYSNFSCMIHDPINRKQYDKNLEPIEVQIIKMKYQGYSTGDIALITGRTQPAIKSRIHRIRLKMSKPQKTRHIRDVPRLPEKPKYTPTKPAKVYKFTPSIKPKKMPKPREPKGTVGTGDIKPKTWSEYFKKKVSNG